MHYDLEPESRLAWESFQYFRNWDARLGGGALASHTAGCGFTRTGFIQIVRPEFTQQLAANVMMHQRIGIPSLLVTPEDVKRLIPHFFTDDFEIAAYEPESGYADPRATSTSLMDAARRRGASLLQGCTVTGIQADSGKVKGVSTSQGTFSAPIIINAAGPWAARGGKDGGC